MTETNTYEIFITLGPPLIIAFGTIIAAIIKRSYDSKRKKIHGQEARGLSSIPASWIAILGLFFSFTAVLAIVSIRQLDIANNIISVEKELLKDELNLLIDFPRTPEKIGFNIFSMDREAAAILDGAGPSEWKTDKETLKRGEVFFVETHDFIEFVTPKEDSNRVQNDSCGIMSKGKLYVQGFSIGRQSALLEYFSPDEAAGSRCKSGTYLFYPIPPRIP